MKTYLGWPIDFSTPAGADGFTGPQSVSWRVFKNPVALAIGGVAAVLLEFADARIRTGVWEHSTFRTDPLGRARRTGMAALIGVYAPEAAARRVIAGVANMHAAVQGMTPDGAPYSARDPDLCDWVAATASWGFATAYDAFVAPLPPGDRDRMFVEGMPIARLYGAGAPIASDADFEAMLDRRMPVFAPHPIIGDFLEIVSRGRGAPGLLRPAAKAVARAAASLLPEAVRARLELSGWRLSGLERQALQALGRAAERTPIPGSPPVAACRRLGLPGDFLCRPPPERARLLAELRS